MRSWVFSVALSGCAGGAGIANSTFDDPPADPGDDDDDEGTSTTSRTSGVSLSLSGPSQESTSAEDLTSTAEVSTGSTADVDPTSTSGEDSTTTDAPVCGDGVLEGGEECDGDDLGDMTCPDIDPDYNGGVLACDEGCSFDVAGCVTLQNPYQVCDQVDLAIPDSPGGPISTVITIPDEDNIGVIDSMTVEVELDHTWIGDLTIDVDHGGAAVRLFDRSCGSTIDLHAVFDDAAGAFDCLDADAGNSYDPEDPLAGFAGEEMGNTWTLTVQDNVGADTGTLDRWCVTITWE